MLVGARGREGAGHADEDGRPVAQRLRTRNPDEVALEIQRSEAASKVRGDIGQL